MCRAMSLCCACFALAVITAAAGEVTIDRSTILDGTNQYPFDSLRVIDGPGGATTLNVTTGALVGDGIQVYDTSSVLLVGGQVLGAVNEGVNAYDSSVVSLLGGEVKTSANDGVAARDTSTFYVVGGDVWANAGSGLLVRNESQVFLSGGTVRGFGLLSNQLPAFGAQSAHTSRVEMSGGHLLSELGPAVFVANSSFWSISGGILSAGGESPAIVLANDGQATITGGSYETAGEFAFELRENAQLELRDGDISGGILASGDSQIHVYGFNLSTLR